MAEDKKPAKKAAKKKIQEETVESSLPTVTINEVDVVVDTTEQVVSQSENETPSEVEAVLDFTTVEETTEQAQVEEIQDNTAEIEKAAEGLQEVVQIPAPAELSKQAQGWRDWLAYQRMTPEDFIKKYPSHKMRHLIQEIIDFNAKK